MAQVELGVGGGGEALVEGDQLAMPGVTLKEGADTFTLLHDAVVLPCRLHERPCVSTITNAATQELAVFVEQSCVGQRLGFHIPSCKPPGPAPTMT